MFLFLMKNIIRGGSCNLAQNLQVSSSSRCSQGLGVQGIVLVGMPPFSRCGFIPKALLKAYMKLWFNVTQPKCGEQDIF